MLILAGVGTYSALALIEQAKYTAFINEMKQVDEAVTLVIMEGQLNLKTTEEILADIGEKISAEDLAKMSDGLKYEIMYAREGFPKDKTASPVYYDVNDFAKEESISSIYSVSGEVTGKEQAYIYDEQSASNYKIEPTIIWGVEMHGYEYGGLLASGTGLLEKTKEDNGVPTPEVSVKISDGATNKIKNIEVTATELREGIAEISLIVGEDVIKTIAYNGETQVNTIFEVKQNRTYTIKVTGVYGVSTAKSIKITSLPVTIIFTPDGTEKWVKSQDVTLTIANSSNVQSNEIKYQWTQSSEEPALDTFTQSCTNGETITGEGMTGEWYLWAYYEKKAGEIEIVGSDVFYFDNQAPTANLTSIANSQTSFTLTATASNTHEGEKLKYEIYVNNELVKTVETTDKTVTYKVENVSMGTFNCQVKVTDEVEQTGIYTLTAKTKLYTWERWQAKGTSTYVEKVSSTWNTTHNAKDMFYSAGVTFVSSNGKYLINSVHSYGYNVWCECRNIVGSSGPSCLIKGQYYTSVNKGYFGEKVKNGNKVIVRYEKYTGVMQTTYSKGTTKYSDVSAASSSAYPNGGYQGGYWYVYKGII